MASRAKALRTTFSGPFFRPNPSKTLKQNIRTMMQALAEEGESGVRTEIQAHASQMPHYTGATADYVVGRAENLSGRRWKATMVVSESSPGLNRRTSIRLRASASSIEGRWHPYRKVANAMRSSRAAIRTNLTEGLE